MTEHEWYPFTTNRPAGTIGPPQIERLPDESNVEEYPASFEIPPMTPDGRPTPRVIQRYRYRFDNGYVASVIKGPFTYGAGQDLWEVAVLHPDVDGIVNDTPIADDVIGHCTDAEVAELLIRIAGLPKR